MGVPRRELPKNSITEVFVNQKNRCRAGAWLLTQDRYYGANALGTLTIVTNAVCRTGGIASKTLCVFRSSNVAGTVPCGGQVFAKLVLSDDKIYVLVSVNGIRNPVAVSVDIDDLSVLGQCVCRRDVDFGFTDVGFLVFFPMPETGGELAQSLVQIQFLNRNGTSEGDGFSAAFSQKMPNRLFPAFKFKKGKSTTLEGFL